METLQRLNEEDGVTIIQVTHNHDYAAYGHRVIELLDGRVEVDRQTERAMVSGKSQPHTL